MNELTLAQLKTEAQHFARLLSATPIPALYGVTDGKAVGTHIEQTFREYLFERYNPIAGNAASGIDLPALEVDIKATSIRQPQSSCPFRDASQKVYGLGYHLLVFVYEKLDQHDVQAAQLNIHHVIFIARERTADYRTTYCLREILRCDGNRDDVDAFLEDCRLPLNEVEREMLAKRIMREPPEIGYLNASTVLQWNLRDGQAIETAKSLEGVENLLPSNIH